MKHLLTALATATPTTTGVTSTAPTSVAIEADVTIDASPARVWDTLQYQTG